MPPSLLLLKGMPEKELEGTQEILLTKERMTGISKDGDISRSPEFAFSLL